MRDHHALLSVVSAPRQAAFGRELYPSIFEKAAVYIRDIITLHPFLDGNKRTGITVAFVFLENNGYGGIDHEGEIEHFVLAVIHQKLDIEDIAAWLKTHTKRK